MPYIDALQSDFAPLPTPYGSGGVAVVLSAGLAVRCLAILFAVVLFFLLMVSVVQFLGALAVPPCASILADVSKEVEVSTLHLSELLSCGVFLHSRTRTAANSRCRSAKAREGVHEDDCSVIRELGASA